MQLTVQRTAFRPARAVSARRASRMASLCVRGSAQARQGVRAAVQAQGQGEGLSKRSVLALGASAVVASQLPAG